VLWLREGLSVLQIVAAVILSGSIALMLLDSHEHAHEHEAVEHEHEHGHADKHHEHEHACQQRRIRMSAGHVPATPAATQSPGQYQRALSARNAGNASSQPAAHAS